MKDGSREGRVGEKGETRTVEGKERRRVIFYS